MRLGTPRQAGLVSLGLTTATVGLMLWRYALCPVCGLHERGAAPQAPDAEPPPAEPPAGAAAEPMPELPPKEPPQDAPEAELRYATAICAQWSAAQASLPSSRWGGAVTGCATGSISAEERGAALQLVNLYRRFADLVPIDLDPSLDAAEQRCALMLHANGALSHDPPVAWACWAQEGALAAGKSNIATLDAASAVARYMVDYGNESTMGHRRWILSESLESTSFGSTGEYSCMATRPGAGQPTRKFVAWPPDGLIPLEAGRIDGYDIDDIGWTVQSDVMRLEGAEVKVRGEGGAPLQVTVRALKPGFGSQSAIAFTPVGWRAEAGRRYEIEVLTPGDVLRYAVMFVDCGAEGEVDD